jgi:uncharacterized protein
MLGVRTSRRQALRLGLLAVGGAVGTLAAGCQSEFAGLHLTIATGNDGGVYVAFGNKVAGIWADQLGMGRPKVVETAGSPVDIDRLRKGSADVGFSSADAIDKPDQGPHKLCALARVYDDYLQVVVRDDGPIHTLADLAGKRVSLGSVHSQANLVAQRILKVSPVHGLTTSNLSVQNSADAMGKGTLDAFFWSGGLPTTSITKLVAGGTHVRLLDLGTDVLHAMVTEYPVYNIAQVPVGTYQSSKSKDPVTTLTVPNFLLVTDRMSDDVANALVSAMFRERAELAAVIPAARSMDVHSAIYTEPVPLHPGAEQYYRQTKI